jgi:SAM-dependent methyltransferase
MSPAAAALQVRPDRSSRGDLGRPLRSIVDALLAVGRADHSGATAIAAQAARAAPGALLPAALATFLGSGPRADTYAEPDGFERFIDGGGNRALYRETIAALRGVVAATRPTSLLDLGCGDGRVTVGVVAAAMKSVTLVEPSAALLRIAMRALRGYPVWPNQTTAEAFLASRPAGDQWDLVQATFAMHALPPQGRTGVLRELAHRAGHLALVEFDLPEFADRSEAHARYAANAYERGLAEYPGEEAVAQRFLMPVLVGQFDPGQPRLTFEQPAARWVEDLHVAGFSHVTVKPVADYWWAPAVLIEAS